MAYDITELSKSELEQFRQLVARGRAKGINDDALFYAFECWGLLGLSHALDTSTKAVKEGKLMGLLDEFGLNRQEAQGIARLREATREALDAFKREQRTMQPPTRQKASAPVQKPTPEPPAQKGFWPWQTTPRQKAAEGSVVVDDRAPGPASTARDSGEVLIPLPQEAIDNAVRKLQIPKAVFEAMEATLTAEQLADLLDAALYRAGHVGLIEALRKEHRKKAPFWPTEIPTPPRQKSTVAPPEGYVRDFFSGLLVRK